MGGDGAVEVETTSSVPETSGNTGMIKESVILFQPNATLYISNIDWSIKKNILRRSLLALFERHGKVLEVVTLRREGLRGQAWIIFEDISSAISAQRNENGFKFFEKELKVCYAKEKSDRISKRDGTYIPKDRRVKKNKNLSKQQPNNAELTVVSSTQDPSSTSVVTSSSIINIDSDNSQTTKTTAATNGAGLQQYQQPSSSHGDVLLSSSASSKTGINGQGQGQASSQKTTEEKEEEEALPSNILFAEHLPSECNEMMLAMLFRQYVGYKEVRIPRAGLAFIEFDDEPHATLALRGLNGFNITSADTLNLKYSK